mmetsp:Transcript_34720/g.61087  ORF Transcript_34720/g.61087 Transcript_34720/m.61087 type:complete len:90 (-) Transcript_34720:3754-4023(-)
MMMTSKMLPEPVLQRCLPCSNKLVLSSRRPMGIFEDKPATSKCQGCATHICQDCTRYCDSCDEAVCYVCVKTAFDRDDMQMCPACFKSA